MPNRTHQPGRLERIRCSTARLLFGISAAAADLSSTAAPKNHPWRLLIRSAIEDLSALTTATLTPRLADGSPAPRVKIRRRASIKYALASYLVVAQFVPLLPAVVFYHGTAKWFPLNSTGITEHPVVAPRLRVYVTPRAVDLDRAPDRPIPADL